MARLSAIACALAGLGTAWAASPASSTHDQIPPQTSFTSGPGSRTTDRTPTFGFSSSEGGGNFYCKLDGGAFRLCVSPKTTKRLAYGRHGFYVKALDISGNVDASAAAYSFKVVKR
jgi:hypothetical protein